MRNYSLIAVCAGAALAQAAAIPGRYHVSNHPDGAARPPAYGLRLDELYNATGGHDIFTFDMDHASSNVTLDYDGSSIRIYGPIYGGRDTGTAYANDAYRGIYNIDFTYDLGVGPVPGDDDVWVNTANHSNLGSIDTPLGDSISLVDEKMGYSFRLGDENNDLGHRGFAGISGWGWISYTLPEIHHVYSADWLFTAERTGQIPAPGAALLGMLGLSLIGWCRRHLS